jgi:hypothetical protein
MSKVPSEKFRPFRSRSPRGRGGDEQVFVRRSASPLRHGHCNKERGNGREETETQTEPMMGWIGTDMRGVGAETETQSSSEEELSARCVDRVLEMRRGRRRGRERQREMERERERNRESWGVRGGDAGGYRRDDNGQKDEGRRDAHGRHRDCYGDSRGTEKLRVPQRKNIDIIRQIMGAQGASKLCILIQASAAEFNSVNVATALRVLLQARRDGVPHGVVERALQALEAAALRTIDAFGAQEISNTLHIMAKSRYRPWDQTLVPKLDGRAEALAGTFNSQDVANTLWAYATMGREPCLGVMRELEGQAEALAGTFNVQDVANTLWAYATMGREPGAGLMRELEGRAEALADTFSAQDVANTLWAACVFSILRAPGEGRQWIITIAQRLVSLGKAGCLNTAELCQVHQFFVCSSLEPRLRMEAISDMWTLKETCREAFECTKSAPSAIQQQVSESLRHIVTVPYWEWERCKRAGGREQYLRGKLADCVQTPGSAVSET